MEKNHTTEKPLPVTAARRALGKVLITLEESSGSLFVKGGEALQEHTLQLILHDMQISVPK